MTVKSEVGKVYGNLTVISRSGNLGRGAAWLCQCSCGKPKLARGDQLRRGITKSCGCLNKLSAGESALNSLLYAYRRSARDRGYTFELSREEFKLLTGLPCYYCGSPPSGVYKAGVRGNGDYIYSGVDRVDVTKGYTSNNCVPCCSDCNYKKNEVTPQIIRLAYGYLNAN